MRLFKKLYQPGFSVMEILVAISILGITATAAYQTFFLIERTQYQALKATQNIDKPIAAFNQFFAQYNQSVENSNAIEVLDITPNIDPFINSNRFRLDRIRVLFDPIETSLGVNSSLEELILPFTNLSVADSEAIYYRVLAIPTETCKFTGGTNYEYTFDCYDDNDYTLLKEDFNSLMNVDNVLFFDIGMLDGSICRVTGYNSTSEILTLDSASNCPASSADTDPTESPTVYFSPPRLVFYSSDFSLRFVQSVMDSFANPVNRFDDDIATREPSSF